VFYKNMVFLKIAVTSEIPATVNNEIVVCLRCDAM
jgi:hypothetical protein